MISLQCAACPIQIIDPKAHTYRPNNYQLKTFLRYPKLTALTATLPGNKTQHL